MDNATAIEYARKSKTHHECGCHENIRCLIGLKDALPIADHPEIFRFRDGTRRIFTEYLLDEACLFPKSVSRKNFPEVSGIPSLVRF